MRKVTGKWKKWFHNIKGWFTSPLSIQTCPIGFKFNSGQGKLATKFLAVLNTSWAEVKTRRVNDPSFSFDPFKWPSSASLPLNWAGL